jgi:hypothetical protein
MWDIATIAAVEVLVEQHYYERDSHGYTDKSSLANLAEKCRQSGYVAKKCKEPGCKGGLHETGEFCTACRGSGYQSKRVSNNPNQSHTCPACKGSMYDLPRDKDERMELLKHGPWEAVTRITGAPKCKRCNGAGAIPNFEVQPKTNGEFGRASLDATDAADKSTVVGDTMRLFQRKDPEGEHVLMLLFGAGGALRASYLGQQYGREIALWKLTRAGGLLVQDELARDSTLSFDRALLAASQRVNDTVRALANLADNEAKILKQRAMHGLWAVDEETGGHLGKEAHRRIDRRSA